MSTYPSKRRKLAPNLLKASLSRSCFLAYFNASWTWRVEKPECGDVEKSIVEAEDEELVDESDSESEDVEEAVDATECRKWNQKWLLPVDGDR